MLRPAELAFGTERNGNLAVEALALEEALLHAGANEVEGVGPFSIEVEPVLALKLWARILSPGQCPSSNCHTKQQERKKQSSHHNSTFNVVVRAKIRKRIKNEELRKKNYHEEKQKQRGSVLSDLSPFACLRVIYYNNV